MKIIDGFSEHLTKEDLKPLILKIANMLTYKEELFDSLVKTDKERLEFNQLLKNDALVGSIFTLLFLEKGNFYWNLIPEALEYSDLSRKQKNNFINYYSSVNERARELGFYNDYTTILNKLVLEEEKKTGIAKYLHYILSNLLAITLGIVILYGYYTKSSPKTEYIFYTILLTSSIIFQTIFRFNEDSNKKFRETKSEIFKLNDYLISTHKKELINGLIKQSKNSLLKAGLINKEGEIIKEKQKKKVA